MTTRGEWWRYEIQKCGCWIYPDRQKFNSVMDVYVYSLGSTIVIVLLFVLCCLAPFFDVKSLGLSEGCGWA